MAGLRPFRGLRYTQAAGDLNLLLAPPSSVMTPAQREGFANRGTHNAVALSAPEGHGDDRSKFIRYARSAARLAEWRREGLLALEDRPAFYRLTQRFGSDHTPRTTLFAIVSADDLTIVEAIDPKLRDERLRLLEATQTAFEPAVAFYADPDGRRLAAVRSVPATHETAATFEGLDSVLEPISDPSALETLQAAFHDTTLFVADGAEGVEAAKAFPGSKGVLVALASQDDAYVRLAVHRVLRRLPGTREETLARLSERFEIEEHHNRNLSHYVDKAQGEGRLAFGMATEGGLGYLLTSRQRSELPASVWLYREVFGPLFGMTEGDPTLAFTDPVQAVRAADEGAAAAFILPRPVGNEIGEAHRLGFLLPAHTARTYPAIPAGVVFWPMGDDV